MAHWEYTKTWNFAAKADIPYQYSCCKCGKLVKGKAEIKEELLAKDTARRPSDLGITGAYSQQVQAEVVDNLRKQLAKRRGEIKSGDFSMLEPYKKCPYCGATQKWGVHIASTIFFTLLGLGGLALIVLCIIACVKKGDLIWLACAVVPLLFGGMFAVKAVMGWREMLSAGSGSKQKPEVFFDQLESLWRDQLMK